MERDPIVLAWRAAPRLQAAALALLLGVGGPIVGLALLIVVALVDAALQGALREAVEEGLPGPGATEIGGTLLRLAIPIPERIAEGPLVLWAGWPLERRPLAVAALGGLVLAAAALGLVALGVLRLAAAAEARACAGMRALAVEAEVGAGPAGREDVRGLAALVGSGLREVGRVFGQALVLPALAAATALLAIGVAALVDIRLAFVPPLAIAAHAYARLLGARDARALVGARSAEGIAVERALNDLLRRMPALRAHGTAPFERARLVALIDAEARGVRRASFAVAAARALRALLFAAVPAAFLVGATISLLSHPTGVLGSAVAFGGKPTPGGLAAAGAALALAVAAAGAFAETIPLRRAAAARFGEIARVTAALRSRARVRGPGRLALPAPGALVVAGASGYDGVTGERVSGLDLALPMPSHVALVGGLGSGARLLAGLLAGHAEPTAGRVTYAGTDLAGLPARERAGRLAFAGGSTVLLPGSLRENLLYGAVGTSAASGDGGEGLDARLVAALGVTGLDRLVYARGLDGAVDPGRTPELAARLVEARAAVHDELVADGLDGLVAPFEPDRYNRYATVGENILFGVSIGETFLPARLPGHPFVRAVLEAEDLVRPLAAMGLAIARSTVEIFSGLPDDHPLFDAFSLFPASERAYFEDLVARRPPGEGGPIRRGPAGARERERLIGLALRYSEVRHRFGLLDAELEARLVSARRTFSRLIPASLRPAIEFYDPSRVTAAASLQDNLLFGRIAEEEAGAEARVRAVVRRVLAERDLDGAVYGVGLAGAVDPRVGGSGFGGEGAFSATELAAIDLARCLVREPDVLVVEHALDDLPRDDAEAMLRRLVAARTARGLIVCWSHDAAPRDVALDRIVGIERGALLPASAADGEEGAGGREGTSAALVG